MEYDKQSQESPMSMSDEKHLTTSDGKAIEINDGGEPAVTTADGNTLAIISPAAERALTRKFDLRILPVLAIMYLFNSLDKSNLGNAKTHGLEKTLGLKGTQYNTILSVFFVPYVLTAPFLGILGKQYGPNRVLPLMMFTFGFCTLMVTAAKNFAGIMTLRWFLGMSESAFFPLVIYYQTTFYRRGELACRLAIFYAAQSIASAFGGLLAFGVFQIESDTIAEWRYLFIIEGCCTILFSFFAFFYLPQSAATAKFLSPEEKELAYYRMQVDSSSVVNEKFNLRESFKIFKDWTMAPNFSGAVMLLILAFASDYTRWRFPFVALGFLFTFLGMIIYVGINVKSQLHIAYFATFMMTWGTSAPSVLLDVWYNNNVAHEGRRIVLTSIGVPLANLMGVVSSNIFQNKDAPKYIPALATTAAFGATGLVLTLILGVFMMFDNARRNKKKAERKIEVKDIPTERLRDGPRVDEFRWFY
ncbi:MAG: hypothetical protein L6R42_004171 [Xanthoria sp. 1 TBL-2021]|nr:MAG: hypothetical protein L6R42_004171 [Xanthoria sp. 1 TBL-2021]